MRDTLISTLSERGLLFQKTHEDLAERLSLPCSGYIGFDPTADSLHIGSLVPIMVLAWMQRCGHRPLALVGGATGLIGDPSGKTESRQMLTREDVRSNVNAIKGQIGRFIRFGEGPTDAVMVDNADWFCGMGWIDTLREIGPHFSINRMLSMDSVKNRLEAGGLTFLEFSYMLMQAYDFVHLSRTMGCTLQLGGQDQWGNIVMGVELARRLDQKELFGATMPLVKRSDGSKFGKSTAGNVWLSAERTSVHDFFQFWRNVPDQDVGRYLRYFTFESLEKISALEQGNINTTKEFLALEVTALVHGRAEAEKALESARKAFGAQHDCSGDAIPHAPIPGVELEGGVELSLLMVRAGLCASKGEARRLIQGRGVKLHDAVVEDDKRVVKTADVKEKHLVLAVGKKRFFRFDVV
jgi:tyrosyl-tRNA synthetase